MPTLYYYLRCGDLRSRWVTERSDGHSDCLRDDDVDGGNDDDEGCLVPKMEGITNFSRHLQAVPEPELLNV